MKKGGGEGAEKLPQQLINNSAVAHQDIYMCTLACKPSRRYAFGEFELLSIALLRALHH